MNSSSTAPAGWPTRPPCSPRDTATTRGTSTRRPTSSSSPSTATIPGRTRSPPTTVTTPTRPCRATGRRWRSSANRASTSLRRTPASGCSRPMPGARPRTGSPGSRPDSIGRSSPPPGTARRCGRPTIRCWRSPRIAGSPTSCDSTADGSGPPTAVTNGRFSVTGFDAAGGTIATTRATIDHPSELFVGDEVRTSVGDALAARMLGWERFTVPTTDGSDEIDCWIMRPAGFDENTTLSRAAQRPRRAVHPVRRVLLRRGPDAGRRRIRRRAGQPARRQRPPRGLGTGDHGHEAPGPPGQRMGLGRRRRRPGDHRRRARPLHRSAIATGSACSAGRYGGYMATWLAAYESDRFRAFCSRAGGEQPLVGGMVERHRHRTSRATTACPTSTIPPSTSGCRRSHGVRNIDKPMLIIHSEEDWRCPIVQAEELWVALRLLGKEVDFYRFPGENHELSRSGSPVHRVQRAEIILDWFTDKLAPADPTSDPEPRTVVGLGAPAAPSQTSSGDSGFGDPAVDQFAGDRDPRRDRSAASSRRNHLASTISLWVEHDVARLYSARKPIIRLCGNGHGWLTRTARCRPSMPTSSRTSRTTAPSRSSPGSTKPARHEYIGPRNFTPWASSASWSGRARRASPA